MAVANSWNFGCRIGLQLMARGLAYLANRKKILYKDIIPILKGLPMSDTSRLHLPFLAAGQAQKHVTHNDALMDLDALIHLSVVSRDLAAPPGSPVDGERRHVGATPTGAFAGHAGAVAEYRDGGWSFHVPRAGWTLWVEDEQRMLVFDGTDWHGILDGGRPDNLERLGLATTADATNPFAARLNKALWTARIAADGGDGDLRMTCNKELAANVVSLLFQSGYSGRAEIGLVGDDDLQLRVSTDGAAWLEALRIDASTGALRLLAGSAGAPALSPAGDSNTGLFFPAADTVSISAGGSESLRCVPGQVLIGSPISVAPSQAPAARAQIAGTAASNSSFALGRFSANAGAASVNFLKSRGGAVGTFAVVQSGDPLGTVNFDGDTGAAFELGARIQATADGAAGAGSMPTRLTFSTSASGSVAPTERLRIASSGAVSFPTIATTASAANAFLDSAAGNSLLRSTSSRRYKHEIAPLDADVADRVLALAPVRYRSSATRDRADWSWYGLLAEDVAAVDPRLVHWGYHEDQYEAGGEPEGEGAQPRLRADAQLRPDAVQYDRLGVLLIDVVRRQRDAIAALEGRLGALERVVGGAVRT